jgi:hypothetical protein
MRLSELTEIRIIVNPGSGFGHQKAAITLMKRLRELGFKGVFDVRYDDHVPPFMVIDETKTSIPDEMREVLAYAKTLVGGVGRALNVLMPEFTPTPPLKHDPGQTINETTNGLGPMRITRLPYLSSYYDMNTALPKTTLTISAADDRAKMNDGLNRLQKYNTGRYISLQPTDWNVGERFVCPKRGNPIQLDDDLLLVCEPQFKAEDLQVNQLNAKEKRILDLVKNGACYTQFVYTCDIYKTSSAIPVTDLINAHKANISKGKLNDKPIILLCPRAEKGLTELTEYHDLTKNNLTESELSDKNGSVIIVNTGDLSPAFFHYLLASTSFPPLLEGANTIAYCDLTGLPYIYCCDSREPFRAYDQVPDKTTQALHEYASKCVANRNADCPVYVDILANYLDKSVNDKSAIQNYHASRANAIKNERADITPTALAASGVELNPKKGCVIS